MPRKHPISMFRVKERCDILRNFRTYLRRHTVSYPRRRSLHIHRSTDCHSVIFRRMTTRILVSGTAVSVLILIHRQGVHQTQRKLIYKLHSCGKLRLYRGFYFMRPVRGCVVAVFLVVWGRQGSVYIYIYIYIIHRAFHNVLRDYKNLL